MFSPQFFLPRFFLRINCEILLDVSSTTVEAVLGIMIKDKKIEIVGNGRNARYRKR